MPQLSYFPYLCFQNDQKIDFGNGLVIWHFYSQAEHRIPDLEMRKLITSLVEANVQGDSQEKIKGVGVISIGSTDFREFSPSEEAMVQEAKLILFLTKLAKTNVAALDGMQDGHSLSTSENFEPVYQNFQIGNDRISEKTGYIVNVGIVGYRLHEKKFYKPSHVVISPFGMRIDGDLFGQLFAVRTSNKQLFSRILRATELVFQSYYNTQNLSRNARILLMAASFEMLLHLPERNGRKHFKDLIEKHTDLVGERKYYHYYKDRKGTHRDKNRSMKVLWADSFFQLRNHIVHGNFVPSEEYLFHEGNRHTDIAILFFVLLVKKLINEKVRRKEKPFLDYIEWKKREDQSTGFHYEDESLRVALTRHFRERQRLRKSQ